mmetsp:Transcript_153307/g.491599  ORF Transcript_153307/g.491599 Transcript_153307/m.491599 type:complete len:364 (+) Transcript_153307:150-1241(+)
MARSVPLEDVQGQWVASGGTVVEVGGAALTMNGMPFGGGLKLDPEDARLVLGYGIFQAVSVDATAGTATWLAPGPMELLWRRSCDQEIRERTEQMKARMNERAATCGGQAFNVGSELEAVQRLNELMDRWREGPLVRVRSCDICPDWTNRAQTGLSVDHVHYLASQIAAEGFRSRRRGAEPSHDVPVVLREDSEDSEMGCAALERWRSVAGTCGFPPFLLDGKREFFCSLGNGHFSQALNLFRTGAQGLFSGRWYEIGSDAALQEALDDGIDSIVLSREMPVEDRRFVSEMLNRNHGRTWHVGDDGNVTLDEGEHQGPAAEQFVALSKVLDAEELSCLVRWKLGVQPDVPAQGFFAHSSHVSS